MSYGPLLGHEVVEVKGEEHVAELGQVVGAQVPVGAGRGRQSVLTHVQHIQVTRPVQ